MPVFHLALEPQVEMAIFTELARLLPQHVCHVRNWVRTCVQPGRPVPSRPHPSDHQLQQCSARVLVYHLIHDIRLHVQEGNTLLFEAVEQGRPLDEVRFVLEQVTHREGLLDRNQVCRLLLTLASH